MTIVHHPDDEFVAAFAAGALDLGQHVAIATHLAACSQCREFARSLESVGGAMLSETAPATLSAGALDRALKRLNEPALRLLTARPHDRDAPDGLPRFVKAYGFGAWRGVAPSVAMRPIRLPEPSRTRVFLLKVRRGARLLEHAHTGFEMTCVLSGEFSHDGGSFAPGDFDFCDDSVQHTPRIDGNEDCVSLVAMQGELCWQGWLGRFIQPFIRL